MFLFYHKYLVERQKVVPLPKNENHMTEQQKSDFEIELCEFLISIGKYKVDKDIAEVLREVADQLDE